MSFSLVSLNFKHQSFFLKIRAISNALIYQEAHVWVKTAGLIQRHLHKRITLVLKDQRGTLYTYNLLLSKSDFPFTYDNVK